MADDVGLHEIINKLPTRWNLVYLANDQSARAFKANLQSAPKFPNKPPSPPASCLVVAKHLDFMLGNREELVPNIVRFYLNKELMFTAQGPN